MFISMESDYVSELRPLTGLLFILQMVYENGEPWWNDIDRATQKNSKKTLSKVVPWLRWLVAGISPRRPGSIHVGFVVDKVALGQVFSEFFGFPLSISFHRRSPNSYHLGNA
jgi:hypothetical protein